MSLNLTRFKPSQVWSSTRQVSLFGAPFGFGQSKKGLEKTPEKLRHTDLVEALQTPTRWEIHDHGDISIPQTHTNNYLDYKQYHLNNQLEAGHTCQEIYQTIINQSSLSDFIVTIGGDHSISLGTLPAILELRPQTKIIWVDAHADINTPQTTQTKNIHGMVLGLTLKNLNEPQQSISGFEWLQPCVSASDIIYLGLRDLDPEEKLIIKKLGIKYFTMFDIKRLGIEKVMKEVKDFIGDDNLHLSFDIDACDPIYAASTGTPVSGGFSLLEAEYLCHYLAETKQLTSMDLVEINTLIKPVLANQTLEIGKKLITTALGCNTLSQFK